ncbi:MAG TPA: hypothetical protein VM533_09925, partial [Fimbriiglobus sp.]|nr:hypothetical protein [Fimbriiglobus sp.]
MSPRASLAMLVLAVMPAAGEDPAVTAARDREQAVHTARFEVHVREVHAKGSRSDRVVGPFLNPVPAEEVVLE